MRMSARPAEQGDGHDVIHLGDETAVVVVRRHAALATARWFMADQAGMRPSTRVSRL
jgi:hypothetical protein